MRDVHQMVVDDVCKIVCRIAVGFQKDLVLQLAVFNGNVAIYNVVESCGPLDRHLLADDIGRPGSQELVHLFLGKITAMAVVAAALLRFMQRVQAFLGAETIVRLPFPDQLLRIGLIEILALALDIGAIISANIRALVVLQAHLVERPVDHIDCALHQTFLIGILNAQHKLAAHGLGNQIFVQRRTQISHMHKPCGARRKPCSHCLVLHS